MDFPEPKPPVRIWQNAHEFARLLEVYKVRQPKTILEIGSESGGTLWYWIQFAPPGAHVITCDVLLPSEPSSANGHQLWPEWAEKKGIRFDICNMLSTSDQFPHSLKDLIRPDQLDFCFIDGQHDYEAVKSDFELCYKHLADNGLICLHDIAFPHIDRANEVDTLWAELEEIYNTSTIISPIGPNGIGIVWGKEKKT